MEIKTYETLIKGFKDDYSYEHKIIEIKKFPKNNIIMNISNKKFKMCVFINCTFSELQFYSVIFDKCEFRNCNFSHVTFNGCDFNQCEFYNTDFDLDKIFDSYICYCNGRFSTITNSNLRGTYITNSTIQVEKCENINAPQIVPEVGAFIGWKKACHKDIGSVIIKLQIPASAKRLSFGRKCRCNKAKVLKIYGFKYHEGLIGVRKNMLYVDSAVSIYDKDFVYKVGEMVEVPDFDEECNECSKGIHFFLSEKEANLYR